MFPNWFYDKTCSIYAVTPSSSNGSQKKARTLVCENIKCSFWKSLSASQVSMAEGEIARRVQGDLFQVNIPSSVGITNVRRGYDVELYESDGTSTGLFTVSSDAMQMMDITGKLDNLHFFVHRR